MTSRYVTDAQLAELPEGLRALAGEVRQLAVRSTRLAVVPGWVRELTRVWVSTPGKRVARAWTR